MIFRVYNHGEHISQLWKDPNSTYNSPEYRAKKREGAKRSWKALSEENKERRIKGLTKRNEDKEACVGITKQLWEDPKYRQKQMKIRRSKKFKVNMSKKTKQAHHKGSVYDTPEYKQKHRDGLINYYENPEARKKSSETMLEIWEDPEYRSKMIKRLRSKESLEILNQGAEEYWGNPENRQKRGEWSKERWDDFVYVQKVRGRCRPTEPERKLIDIVEEFQLPFKYVGDGKFVVDSMNPDFIDTLGLNKIVEVFGDYWHKDEDPQERIDAFKKYGYDCLVIWEHELKNLQTEPITEKITEFITRGD